MNSTKTYNIQPAVIEDYHGIQSLLGSVNLPIEGVQEHFNHFITLYEGEKLVGLVGLEIYEDKAILRSLAVNRNRQGEGYGRLLTDKIIQQAHSEGISELYLLTETAETFFARFGFETISRDLVDRKVKTAIQFQYLCPVSAPCMRLELDNQK
ncbi:GNAT family N-acetyltransferase [candidate division KSB1 bacterium]|nr:GNAT family N-acetyltransferase [candidate division KSB1 bacterium]